MLDVFDLLLFLFSENERGLTVIVAVVLERLQVTVTCHFLELRMVLRGLVSAKENPESLNALTCSFLLLSTLFIRVPLPKRARISHAGVYLLLKVFRSVGWWATEKLLRLWSNIPIAILYHYDGILNEPKRRDPFPNDGSLTLQRFLTDVFVSFAFQ